MIPFELNLYQTHTPQKMLDRKGNVDDYSQFIAISIKNNHIATVTAPNFCYNVMHCNINTKPQLI